MAARCGRPGPRPANRAAGREHPSRPAALSFSGADAARPRHDGPRRTDAPRSGSGRAPQARRPDLPAAGRESRTRARFPPVQKSILTARKCGTHLTADPPGECFRNSGRGVRNRGGGRSLGDSSRGCGDHASSCVTKGIPWSCPQSWCSRSGPVASGPNPASASRHGMPGSHHRSRLRDLDGVVGKGDQGRGRGVPPDRSTAPRGTPSGPRVGALLRHTKKKEHE